MHLILHVLCSFDCFGCPQIRAYQPQRDRCQRRHARFACPLDQLFQRGRLPWHDPSPRVAQRQERRAKPQSTLQYQYVVNWPPIQSIAGFWRLAGKAFDHRPCAAGPPRSPAFLGEMRVCCSRALQRPHPVFLRRWWRGEQSESQAQPESSLPSKPGQRPRYGAEHKGRSSCAFVYLARCWRPCGARRRCPRRFLALECRMSPPDPGACLAGVDRDGAAVYIVPTEDGASPTHVYAGIGSPTIGAPPTDSATKSSSSLASAQSDTCVHSAAVVS